MLRKLMKFAATPVLALAIFAAGCDQAGQVMAPEVSSESQFLDLSGSQQSQYRAIKGLPVTLTRTDERVIQPTSGGSVGVAGNVVIVPAGAVSKPTLFRMRLAAPGLLGLTENRIELRAYEQDEFGSYTVDVGPRGFLKPVKLRMTYEWSTDLILNPGVLRIVWQIDATRQEVYNTTIDPSGRTVSTELTHFSDYLLAMP